MVRIVHVLERGCSINHLETVRHILNKLSKGIRQQASQLKSP